MIAEHKVKPLLKLAGWGVDDIRKSNVILESGEVLEVHIEEIRKRQESKLVQSCTCFAIQENE